MNSNSQSSLLQTSNAEPGRGWNPVVDGRFRVPLYHSYRSSDLSPAPASSPGDGLGEDGNSGGATASALGYNACTDDEPCVQFKQEASLVNAINSAYTSSGYPSVVTTGNARGAVYGSFVDLKNPTLDTLSLPPQETIIIAPAAATGSFMAAARGQDNNDVVHMETLLSVQWKRAMGLISPESSNSEAPAGSSSTGVGTGGGAGTSFQAGSSFRPGVTPVATGGGGGGSTEAGSPTGAGASSAASGASTAAAAAAAKASSLAQHIQNFPEGVHGTHSTPNLIDLVLRGKLPDPTPEQQQQQQPGQPPLSNAPPAPLPPYGAAPIQHTLVSANSFNHLSIYFIAHQDGRFLYSAPIQTLSVSIASRKVTAQHLFMMAEEDVHPTQGSDGYYETSSGASSPTPVGFGDSGPSGAAAAAEPQRGGTASPIVAPNTLTFRDVRVSDADAPTFFQQSETVFNGADEDRKTTSAALVGFVVEPYLMFGNQNGDVFVHSILEGRIVQRLNFNGGSSTCNGATAGTGNVSSSPLGRGVKVICSPVSVIKEVQCGLEKRLSQMAEYAGIAKRNGKRSIKLAEDSGTQRPGQSFFAVPPSLFAVGFDCGQVLLLCVTTQGSWILRQLGNQSFGFRPIECIALRIPSFFVRVWTSYSPPLLSTPTLLPGAKTPPPPSPQKQARPRTTLITSEQTLLFHREEEHIAAISCNDGTIVIVRLPGLEVLTALSVYDYNAVGSILTLTWTANTIQQLLTPDILIASGEDDTMTSFRWCAGALRGLSAFHISELGGGGGNNRMGGGSGMNACGKGGGLQILEKKKFHRSWVNNVSVLPLTLPASRSGTGMPQYIGVDVIAVSYDTRVSHWPILFTPCNAAHNEEEGILFSSIGNLHEDVNNSAFSSGRRRDYVLIEGPTAAFSLHPEAIIRSKVGGGGTSFFLVTMCGRGKVKFWSVALKEA